MYGAFVILIAGLSVQAQNFSVVYNFDVTHGQTPQAGLVRDAAGNLYGTTASGGDATSGVIFKISANGQATVLHTFNDSDGSLPRTDLTLSGSTLYGTTFGGGSIGAGTIFKISTDGSGFKSLYSFTGGDDGSNPASGVIRDSQGNLYGTTQYGGMFLSGVLYRLSPSGTLTPLHGFTGGSDGAMPMAEPIMEASGNLYGTTEFGGDNAGNCVGLSSGCGVVYKVAPDGKLTVLRSFTNMQGDGAYPMGALLRDAAGNLYGTTTGGGGQKNNGTVFKIDSKGNFTRLHSFGAGIPDGVVPQGALVRDSAGNLYGTTTYGGSSSNSGTIFKLAPNGREKVIHSFKASDGTGPQGALLLTPNGVLFGLTTAGGNSDAGVVFKLKLPQP